MFLQFGREIRAVVGTQSTVWLTFKHKQADKKPIKILIAIIKAVNFLITPTCNKNHQKSNFMSQIKLQKTNDFHSFKKVGHLPELHSTWSKTNFPENKQK